MTDVLGPGSACHAADKHCRAGEVPWLTWRVSACVSCCWAPLRDPEGSHYGGLLPVKHQAKLQVPMLVPLQAGGYWGLKKKKKEKAKKREENTPNLLFK